MNPPSLVALTARVFTTSDMYTIIEKIKPLKKIISHIKPCCYTTSQIAVNDAIRHNHVECLNRLLFFIPGAYAFGVTSFAALYGSTECLIFLHKHGFPWDERTCIWAAARGHLNCLQYAHENGCPWDERVCKYAQINMHLNCLEYVCSRGWYTKNGLWWRR